MPSTVILTEYRSWVRHQNCCNHIPSSLTQQHLTNFVLCTLTHLDGNNSDLSHLRLFLYLPLDVTIDLGELFPNKWIFPWFGQLVWVVCKFDAPWLFMGIYKTWREDNGSHNLESKWYLTCQYKCAFFEGKIAEWKNIEN